MFIEATLDFPEEDIDFLRAADVRGRLAAIAAQARASAGAREAGRAAARGTRRRARRPAQRRQVEPPEPAGGRRRGDRHADRRHDARRRRARRSRSTASRSRSSIPRACARPTTRSRRSASSARGRRWRARISRWCMVDAAARRQRSPRPTRRSSRSCRRRCRGSSSTTRSISSGLPAAVNPRAARGEAAARRDGAPRVPVGEDRRGRRAPATGDARARRRARGHGGRVPRARTPPRRLARGAAAHLASAAAHFAAAKPPLELFAEDLRLAHTALAAITGEFTSDDLLGVIFSRFCIGK